jgi:hypothetical protein
VVQIQYSPPGQTHGPRFSKRPSIAGDSRSDSNGQERSVRIGPEERADLTERQASAGVVEFAQPLSISVAENWSVISLTCRRS